VLSLLRKLRRAVRKPATVNPAAVYTTKMSGPSGVKGTLVRVSPDGDFSQSMIDRAGRQVAFWGTVDGGPEKHVWISDIEAGTCWQATSLAGVHGHPFWWPDNRSIVYFSTAGASDSLEWSAARQFNVDRPASNLFRLCTDGGERVRLTEGPWVDERPAVSPKGDVVVFVSNRSGSMNLWALDVKTTALTQITGGPGPDYRPVFSPAGDRIAYFTQSEDGSHQLVVASWPEMTVIPVETAGQFAWVHGPFWCSTSDAILIHALRRGESSASLWMLDLRGGKATRVSIPGTTSCSHGTLDAADTTMAFDTRQQLRSATVTIVEGR
jgi:Tol biopolymer transport system component